jgi:2,4-didehydro-3-deoxy-L-rhamnonate hydrolase
MKLIRFGDPGREKPGILLNGDIRIDASGFGSDYDQAFFGGDGLTRLAAWLKQHEESAPRISNSVRLGPPVANPSKIVAFGLNYMSHVTETNSKIPTEPVVFLKASTSLCGPYDNCVIPRDSTKLDYEVELAVIVGKKASYVPKERAMDHVAGYSIMNDYSERNFQLERGGQWTKGKSCDTFAPLGPFIATRDEIPNPHNLGIWLKVNGETRQKDSTANMIFDLPTLMSYISEFVTLLPGDVISTGTPSGVVLGRNPQVWLKPGDVVELGLDGLGVERQTVVAWKPIP